MSKVDNQYSAKDEVASVFIKRTFLQRTFILKSSIHGLVGNDYNCILSFCSFICPFNCPYGEAEIFKTPYAPWDEVHIFGTDRLGRDILSRLIYGARNTMGIAILTTLLAFLIGGGLGLLSAILRGWVINF